VLTVRPATVVDETPALDLLEELFAPPASRAPGYRRERAAAAFQDVVASTDGDVLLAVDDGRPVGLASVYVDLVSMRFGRRCWLEDLVVTASARNRGVGRRLLDAATEWARAHGCTHLGLVSAAARGDAHRFYVANGMDPMLHFTRPV
jgi:GNAT superfamily N-acetyltransferase